MDDLISRAALLEFAHNHVNGTVDCNDIARFPAVDAEPVRHGRWLHTDAYPHRVYCSCCYRTIITNAELMYRYEIPTNFCPNCGAKMSDGGLANGHN